MRDAAFKQLLQVGEMAREMIQKALTDDPPLETRRRLKQLLDTIANAPDPESERTIRAIMVLERIGSPEARAILQSLARGATAARVTAEAAAALQRLGM
jgi:HEAT repeat protein